MGTRKQPGCDTSIDSWWGYGDKPTRTPVSCMKGFCRKPVSQCGPIQKSQGHSADDTKLVTENGKPSMYVYHTMPMVRTLSLCWQVLLQAILRRHQDNYHLANRDWLHDLMTLPGCSTLIINIFCLYPGPHMCNTDWQSGSMLVGTGQGVGCSCKQGNCWVLSLCYSVMNCLMYWYNYCQQGFFQIIGLGTFHF